MQLNDSFWGDFKGLNPRTHSHRPSFSKISAQPISGIVEHMQMWAPVVTTQVSLAMGGGFMRENTGTIPYLEYSALTRCRVQVSFTTRTTMLSLPAGAVLLRNEDE